MREYTFDHKSLSVNYICNDTNSDKSVFLIHGYNGSAERWIPLFQEFKSYKVYAVDLPGHNKSGKLEYYSTEKVTEIVADFINANLNSSNFIVGHSWGAWIAYELAERLGNKINGVFLEDPGWFDEFPDIKEFGPNPFIIENKPKWRTPIDAVNSFRNYNSELFDEKPFEACVQALRFYINDINLALKFNLVSQDYKRLASTVKIKTYIARANPDKGGMLPDNAKRKVLSINSDIILKEFDTGHGIMSEDQKGYFEFLKKFIN